MIKQQAAGKLCIFIVVMALLATAALGLGISPARTTIDYEAGVQKDIILNIVNTEGRDLKLVVFAQGELAQYTDLNYSLVTMKAGEGEKSLAIKLSLPAKEMKPGTHTAEVVVMEFVASEQSEDMSVVKASAAVISQINVNVPYPGKYLEANIFVTEANAGEPVVFTIPVFNLGQNELKEVTAEIIIYGPTNEVIGKATTNTISLAFQGEAKLVGTWNADANPGTYHAVADIEYDGKKARVEKNFNVGNVMVEVNKVTVAKFKLGEIAKFDFDVENKWNRPIGGIYGVMSVYDRDQLLTEYKTASLDLAERESGTLNGYWNTEGVSPGVYNLKLVLHFAGKEAESIYDTAVSLDSIDVDTGLTARAVSSGSLFSRDSLLTILVIVLITINIGWFVFFRKRNKPAKQDSQPPIHE